MREIVRRHDRDADALLLDDADALLFVVNLGSIPLHLWASRARSLKRPDWCILDLDPKGAPMRDVVDVALAIRQLGEALELPTHVKTSGGSGLHVLIPLGGTCTWFGS